MSDLEVRLIGWGFIGILVIIAFFVVRWSTRVTQRTFDDYIRQKIYEVLDERENEYRRYEKQWKYEEYYQSQKVKPGSAEHYEKWKAERENREP